MSEKLFVVFDGPPSHESGRFVEVEDDNGRGRGGPEWSRRGAYWFLGPFVLHADAEALAARVAELEAENAKLRRCAGLAEALAGEFEAAVSSREMTGGMRVTPTGDFIACAQLPSAVSKMRWWAREIRAARAEVDK